jgi:predicted nucleic acid-binding protein
MKIVLDTNAIVSALLCPQSLPAKILGLVLNGVVGIVYELYKSGEVDFLITGNIKHFPKEKNILTPREFIEIIND